MTSVSSTPLHEAVECPDLLTDRSPRGLRVTRITSDPQYAHSHIYMESPVFTPDGARFIYQRHITNPPARSPEPHIVEYWLCDIGDNFALRRLTHESNAIAPSLSPDGQWLYYFLNELDPTTRHGITLMRVAIDEDKREIVQRLDHPLPTPTGQSAAPPSRVYALSTIRADGNAVATGVFIGDGEHHPASWGVVVCDISSETARIVIAGEDYLNPHMQYTRSTDPTIMQDLLVQENIDVKCAPSGDIISTGSGCYVNVVRDDGTHFRRVPCGAGHDIEFCHGHQEWRGNRPTVIVGVDQPGAGSIIEAAPISADPADPTPPAKLPGAADNRNDISRSSDAPQWGHTAFDLSGTRFAGDWRSRNGGEPADTTLHIGTLDEAPGSALRTTYLLHPRSTYTSDQATHPHPCLSPDGNRLLFNTDYSGASQIWMVEGYVFP